MATPEHTGGTLATAGLATTDQNTTGTAGDSAATADITAKTITGTGGSSTATEVTGSALTPFTLDHPGTIDTRGYHGSRGIPGA